MIRFEYRTDTFEFGHEEDEPVTHRRKLTHWLNGLGYEGWEIIKYESHTSMVWALFKRQVR